MRVKILIIIISKSSLGCKIDEEIYLKLLSSFLFLKICSQPVFQQSERIDHVHV